MRQIYLALLATSWLAGCTRPSSPPATAPAPATVPVTQPASARLLIDGKPLTFASPCAQVDNSSDVLRLVLYSDRSPAGSFYLEFPIESADVANGQIRSELSFPRERSDDSPAGFQIGATLLQPRELRLVVVPELPGILRITIEGWLTSGDGAEAAVTGTFRAAVVP